MIGSKGHMQRISRFAPSQIVLRTAPVLRATFVRNLTAMPPSRLGVHEAHLRALQLLLRLNMTCAYIFEQDVVPRRPPEWVRAAMTRLPPKWKYLNMGSCYASCHTAICVGTDFVRNDRSWCRHAYAITRGAAQRVILATRMLRQPGDMTVSSVMQDDALSTIDRWYLQDREFFRYKSRNGRNDMAHECRYVPNRRGGSFGVRCTVSHGFVGVAFNRN